MSIQKLSKVLCCLLLVLGMGMCDSAGLQAALDSIKGASLSGTWNSQSASMLNVPLEGIINEKTKKYQGFYCPRGVLEGFITHNYEDSANKVTRMYLQLHCSTFSNNTLQTLYLKISPFQKSKSNPEQLVTANKELITTTSVYKANKKIISYQLIIDFSSTLHPNGTIEVSVKSKALAFSGSFAPASYIATSVFYAALLGVQAAIILSKKKVNMDSDLEVNKMRKKLSVGLVWLQFLFMVLGSLALLKTASNKFDTAMKAVFYLALLNITLAGFFLRNYQPLFNKRILFILGFASLFYFGIAIMMMGYALFWVLEANMVLLVQMMHFITRGGRGGIPKEIALLYAVTRVPILYMLWSHDNIMHFHGKLGFGLLYLITISVEFSMIYSQQIFGGWVLLPKSINPDYFNYYREYFEDDPLVNDQCAICLIKLNNQEDNEDGNESQNETEMESKKQPQPEPEIERDNEHENEHADGGTGATIDTTIDAHMMPQKKSKVMQTPCNHIFHTHCLSETMGAKLVCPICKAKLPPLATMDV